MISQHFNPVRLVIGKDSVNTLVDEIKRHGNKCLLVAQDNNEAMINLKNRIIDILKKDSIEFDTFSDIRPNPLVSDIQKGVSLVRANHYDVIVALGGGSVIDSAKILSVSNDNNLDLYEAIKIKLLAPNKNKLPLISIPTTAGTGSHCTQAAVISDDNNIKHSIFSNDFFSSVAIVDYSLTMSLPPNITASTGFDSFCHLSESYIMGNLSPIMEVINIDAMTKLAATLPKLIKDNKEEYREVMSIVDSCAGICLSNGGAIIPHAFGEAISSVVYRISHGVSLAICYPSFVENFFNNSVYGDRIKTVIGIINNDNLPLTNGKEARTIMERFISSLSIKYTLNDYDVSIDETKRIYSILTNQKRFKKEEVNPIIEDIVRLN